MLKKAKKETFTFSQQPKKKKLENSFDNKSYVIWVGSKMNQRIKNLNCKNFFKNNKITVVAKKKTMFHHLAISNGQVFLSFYFLLMLLNCALPK